MIHTGCNFWSDKMKSGLSLDMCMMTHLSGYYINKLELLDFTLNVSSCDIDKCFEEVLFNLMQAFGATCICYKCLCKYAWILPLQFCAVCIAPTQEYWMCLLIHLYWHWVFSSIHLPLMTIKDSCEARKVDKYCWFELVYLF